MDRKKQLICSSDDLEEKGSGFRFSVTDDEGNTRPAFAIRFNQEIYGYINRCAHIQVELDWQHGRFFDSERELLICATHGALYAPDTGICVAGPCKGARLEKLELVEENGSLFNIVKTYNQ